MNRYVIFNKVVYLEKFINNKTIYFSMQSGFASYYVTPSEVIPCYFKRYAEPPTYSSVAKDSLKAGDIVRDTNMFYLIVSHEGKDLAISQHMHFFAKHLICPEVMNANVLYFSKL